MKRRQYVTLVLATLAGTFMAVGSLQAQYAPTPTNVRLVATQMDAPASTYGSGTYYYQDEFDQSTPTAPTPETTMPQESETADQVPSAPKAPAAPAAPAPDPAYASAKPGTTEILDPQPQPCPPPAPWKLFQSPCLDCYGINVGGWIQQGITFNAMDPIDRFNGPVATNDRDGEYQLNQLWMYIDRPVGQRGSCWELGGRVDMIYGTDYRFGISHGLDDRINDLDSYYGLVIPQLYGAVGNDQFNVILGHFAGILNYEQVPAVANFFYSHSYQMGYGEPLLVTGMLANWKVTENWSLAGGFHRGWMMWEDYNEDLDFMGGIAWTGDNKRDRLAYNVDIGPQDPAGQQQRFVQSLIYQRDLTERFTYAMEYTLGWEENGNPRTGLDASWYGISNYLYYTLTQTWKAGMRFEWFRDDDGARVAGVGHLVTDHGWDGGPGFAGDFYELTMGLNWRPNANVVLRPEIRWDWYRGTTDLAGNLPFDGGDQDHQFLLATDLIVTY